MSSLPIEIQVIDLPTDKLRDLQAQVNAELAKRQEALQATCDHPELTHIMWMRPGAFYLGCKVGQASAREIHDAACASLSNDPSEVPYREELCDCGALDKPTDSPPWEGLGVPT